VLGWTYFGRLLMPCLLQLMLQKQQLQQDLVNMLCPNANRVLTFCCSTMITFFSHLVMVLLLLQAATSLVGC